MISDIEKGKFLKLFNRGGYVLDFSTNGFDVFTMASVGVPLCQRYQASKGQSLTTFLYDASEAKAFKLLSDLLEYYEENYRPEFDDAEAPPYSSGRYDRSNKGTYLRCREIIDREKAHSTPFAEFRNEFGSGHGKSASFRAAPVRHAKLAVGCSLTLCEYLWETYEWRIGTGALSRG